MRKSKYLKFIKVNENTYAIFNNLLIDVIYVNKSIFNLIKKEQYDKIPEKTIKNLINKGIIVRDESLDSEALEVIKSYYLKTNKRIDTLYLIVAQGCNLGCKYCFAENENGNWKNSKMNFDVAKVSIDKFVNHIKENNIADATIMLFGGEPLMNWSLIEEIVCYVNDSYPNVLNFSIVTNGTLINNEKALFFKKNNIIPAISIDGPKEINDQNRVFKKGDRSVYNSVLKAIKVLKENECNFGLSITLTPDVISKRKEMIEWIKELKVKDVYLNPLHCDYGDGWEKHYKNNTEFLIQTFYDLLEINIVNSRILRQINSFVSKSFYFSDCCAGGLNQLTIKPSGDVMVCQCNYFLEKNNMGNILKDSFKEIIEGKNANYWIENVPIMKKKCLDCECIFICGGSCVNQDTNLFGTKNANDESYCIYIKTIFDWLIKKTFEERG